MPRAKMDVHKAMLRVILKALALGFGVPPDLGKPDPLPIIRTRSALATRLPRFALGTPP